LAVLALILTVVWLIVVIGLRGYIAYRQTGSIVGPSRSEVGSPAWWAKAVSSIGLLLAFAAPIAELAGLEPISVLDHPAVRWAGAGLVVAGILATLGAQQAMGASWRGDVDPDARTPLVTDGPFRLVRNPIFTCTVATAIGLALMVPNVLAALMLVAFVAGIQIQVRLVEEPYLEGVHGDAYRSYAARTGRFLPGIGRGRTRA
jgi:protein-S-isoprenylcysteine O-methyltransferase Ste14